MRQRRSVLYCHKSPRRNLSGIFPTTIPGGPQDALPLVCVRAIHLSLDHNLRCYVCHPVPLGYGGKVYHLQRGRNCHILSAAFDVADDLGLPAACLTLTDARPATARFGRMFPYGSAELVLQRFVRFQVAQNDGDGRQKQPPPPAFSGLLTDNAKRFGIKATTWLPAAYAYPALGWFGTI